MVPTDHFEVLRLNGSIFSVFAVLNDEYAFWIEVTQRLTTDVDSIRFLRTINCTVDHLETSEVVEVSAAFEYRIGVIALTAGDEVSFGVVEVVNGESFHIVLDRGIVFSGKLQV